MFNAVLLSAVVSFGAASPVDLVQLPLIESPDVALQFDPSLGTLTSDSSATVPENELPPGDPFAKGAWIWMLYGGGSFGDEAGEVYNARLGVGYHLLDNLSFNFEGVFAYADGDPTNINMGAQTPDAVGGGLDLIIRWHFLRHEKLSLYLDGGCGVIVFNKEWPGHGTNLNFTPQVGVGFTFDLNDGLMLMGGARWYHISNARINGYDNNIGYDGGLIYLGVMWPF
jgi:hypothetical protein